MAARKDADVEPEPTEGEPEAAPVEDPQVLTDPATEQKDQHDTDESGRLIVTGCDHVWVHTDTPGQASVVQVYEGQAIPANALDGEVERLEAAGAFKEHPRHARQRQIEAAAAIGTPIDWNADAASED